MEWAIPLEERQKHILQNLKELVRKEVTTTQKPETQKIIIKAKKIKKN